ncbi:MAG: hypothetical protein LBS21_14315 [Clostridiales bacterium]|jgi:hypothetical protein|nr:hypothetical protein [Clostridiales bacterium]
MTAEIKIRLTRDSVCMGDDVDDHTKNIVVNPKHDAAKTMMCIAKEYLPSVAGYGHIWDCILNGVKCATINGNCKSLTLISEITFTDANDLRFKYHSANY